MASSLVSRRRPVIIAQASRLMSRAVQSPIASRAGFRAISSPPIAASAPLQRPFSACARLSRGIMPDSATPTTKDSPTTERKYAPAELSEDEYHELANTYLDNVLSKFEHLQESREDLDVEYSAGVMTITVADKGTFVINKQPPNKQIWFSSPISGPKRYDWSVASEGQGDKEDTATGYWVYARDGTTLDSLILEEINVDIEGPVDVV